ncbi:MAG: toprim domain-containing protein, partial [Chloroflexi bacterium]|nr:toprim domain-containing protein [Chloroflexota bacterium]
MNIDNILERLPDHRPTSNGWQARCPAHEDDRASLCIHSERDGRILVHCQAGCETKDVLAKLGLSWRDLFSQDAGNVPPKASASRGRMKRGRSAGDKRIIATYDYVNETGELLYQVQRTERKQFIQRRRVIRDNMAKWVYDIKGVTRVLYRLPRVKNAVASGEAVYVVEGEKDVHSLEAWGLVGTTQSGGASAKWLDSFSHTLSGADVVVIPDNDTPGRKCAENVAQSLMSAGANVRVVMLPGLKEHGDFTDWVTAGGTPEKLAALLADAPPFVPGSIHKEYRTPEGVSRIGVNNVPLREVGRAAIRAIVSANHPPCLFLKGGAIVRYRETELSQPLI